MKYIFTLLLITSFYSFSQLNSLELNYKTAEKLADIPLACLNKEFPNKLSQVLNGKSDLKSPKKLHPIFFGCFDWHSSVHGHWLLTKFLNDHPATNLSENIAKQWNDKFTLLKCLKEVNYFSIKNNTNFERTYGWAWFLKLHGELLNSKHKNGQEWAKALQPLAKVFIKKYSEFLPKLAYPVRVGTHTNTAFGLSFALDYARQVKDVELEKLIIEKAKQFYLNDKKGPLKWEPSGFDFLSPCLEEANLMANVLTPIEFKKWIKGYLPQLLKKQFKLEPGKVIDRTDGNLVHLDGLNFSRAWCLYRLSKHLPKQKENLIEIANNHVKTSINQVIGSHYMGSHWLASFLVYALEMKSEVSDLKAS